MPLRDGLGIYYKKILAKFILGAGKLYKNSRSLKLAVVISTYFRIDGRSKFFLERSLSSIRDQHHKDYKVFLIGDKYEESKEFEDLAKGIIPEEKIYFENLNYAKERDAYGLGSEYLWCSGGVNAVNYGIKKAISEGYEYICHLDHDDIWFPNHLEQISNFLDKSSSEYVFIATYCSYLNKYLVPTRSRPGEYFPVEGDVVHSSTCVNFSRLGLMYRDVFSETGRSYPADADLWIRISDHMKKYGYKGVLLGEVSVLLDKRERE